MSTRDDWRLTGQEAYLSGAVLCWRRYRASGEESDHDHCEFCFAKFAEPGHAPDALHVGYSTLDAYRWICETCFRDFQPRFRWTVVERGDY